MEEVAQTSEMNGAGKEPPEYQGNRKQLETVTLENIRAGDKPFACWSTCELVVTQGGKRMIRSVRIKSIGIADIMDQIARKAPSAPKRLETVNKDSPAGRQLGLKHDRVSEFEDNTNPDYQKKMQDYEQKSMYRLILHALAIPILDAHGVMVVKPNDEFSATEVLDEDAAIEILRGSGLTNTHFQQLSAAVQKLSSADEAITDRD